MTEHFRDEDFSAWIDKTMPEEEQQKLQRHLSRCATCRKTLAEREAHWLEVKHLVHRKLGEKTPSSRMNFEDIGRQMRRTSSPRRWPLVAAGAAAGVLLTSGVLSLVSPNSPPNPAAIEAPTHDEPAPQEEDWRVPDEWRFFETGKDRCVPGLARNFAHEGKTSTYLRSSQQDPEEFCSFQQGIYARPYRGKKMRFSAWIYAEKVSGWSGLWMRVDGDEETLAFDNMRNRPISGTRGWREYFITLDVDPKAKHISLGFMLGGKGKVWMDEVQFQEAPTDAPSTDVLKTTPGNLNFEDQ